MMSQAEIATALRNLDELSVEELKRGRFTENALVQALRRKMWDGSLCRCSGM
jgi:hypothetical protein